MNRRQFLGVAGPGTLAPLGLSVGAAEAGLGRDDYELRQYLVETEEQKAGLGRRSPHY